MQYISTGYKVLIDPVKQDVFPELYKSGESANRAICCHAGTGYQIADACIADDSQENDPLVREVNKFAVEVYENAKLKGFYDNKPVDGERIALIHAELSEALECFRDGTENSPCDKPGCREITKLEEELADVIIRVLDFAAYKDCTLGDALRIKHEYNKTRPVKHGRKF